MSAPDHTRQDSDGLVRLVLFDLDGTLVSTGGAGMRAFDRALAGEFDPGLALHSVRPAGMTDPGILHAIFAGVRQSAPTPDEEQRFFARYLEFLEEEVRSALGFRVLPGVRELLAELSAHPAFLVGLGTGNLQEGARIKLEHAGLNRYFRVGGFGSDARERPAVLEAAIARGAQAAGGRDRFGAVIVVGDTPRDIAAARAVGARVLAVASGPYSRAELDTARPDRLADDLTETRRLIEWFLS